MPTLTIGGIEAHNCGMALCVSGDGQFVEVGRIAATNTALGAVVHGNSRVKVGSMEHHPDEPPEEGPPAEKRRKYFSGFSFSKGDHLKA